MVDASERDCLNSSFERNSVTWNKANMGSKPTESCVKTDTILEKSAKIFGHYNMG
jgi:hypothetical protein